MKVKAFPVRVKSTEEHQDQDIDIEDEESLFYLIPRNLNQCVAFWMIIASIYISYIVITNKGKDLGDYFDFTQIELHPLYGHLQQVMIMDEIDEDMLTEDNQPQINIFQTKDGQGSDLIHTNGQALSGHLNRHTIDDINIGTMY